MMDEWIREMGRWADGWINAWKKECVRMRNNSGRRFGVYKAGFECLNSSVVYLLTRNY